MRTKLVCCASRFGLSRPLDAAMEVAASRTLDMTVASWPNRLTAQAKVSNKASTVISPDGTGIGSLTLPVPVSDLSWDIFCRHTSFSK